MNKVKHNTGYIFVANLYCTKALNNLHTTQNCNNSFNLSGLIVCNKRLHQIICKNLLTQGFTSATV